MRTIKFRGKRLDNGKWLYGNLVELRNPFNPNDAPACFIMPKEVNIAAPDSIAEQEVVIPDTVGQFTGLLDKNGQEIYEGDIVANDFGNAYIVNMAVEWCTDGYWALHEIDGDDTMHFVADYLKEIELIGNIHDNPELLKQNE